MCRRSVGLHRLPASAIVELHPIIYPIFCLSGVLQCLREEISEIVVVWLVLEAKVADIAEVFVELLCYWLVMSQQDVESSKHTWKSLAEIFYGSGLLLLTNLLILLLVCSGFEPLPRQSTSQEVHEYVT